MIKTLSARVFSKPFNQRDVEALKSIGQWVIIIGIGYLMFGCSSLSPEEQCEKDQEDYEIGYYEKLGTLEGSDPNRYVFDETTESCVTNQGIQG